MKMVDIISKKRYGMELTNEEINFFVENYTNGNIPDYQVSALLMAICFQKMNMRETSDLTMAMVNSGDVLDLSNIDGIKVKNGLSPISLPHSPANSFIGVNSRFCPCNIRGDSAHAVFSLC